MATKENLQEIASEYKFNFELKDEQVEVICSILEEHDTLAVLPTGFGKSFCYVAPLLMKKKVSL